MRKFLKICYVTSIFLLALIILKNLFTCYYSALINNSGPTTGSVIIDTFAGLFGIMLLLAAEWILFWFIVNKAVLNFYTGTIKENSKVVLFTIISLLTSAYGFLSGLGYLYGFVFFPLLSYARFKKLTIPEQLNEKV